MDNESQSLTPHQNPLLPYIRQPEVYIRLPSQGYFGAAQCINVTPTKELAISAMTTNDDLLLKTPEALLNGDAMAKVIQSCCPDVKNVYDLCTPDVDALLLAIRQASYGEDMDIDASCPKCEHSAVYGVNIPIILASIKPLEEKYEVKLSNNVTVSVRPFTYSDSIKESMKKYEEGQVMRALIEKEELEESGATDRAAQLSSQFGDVLKSLSDLMVELCANCILEIRDPDGNIIQAEAEHIFEWVKFLPRKDAVKIQDQIAEINSSGIAKTQKLECEECQHVWETDITFDPSHFFVQSS